MPYDKVASTGEHHDLICGGCKRPVHAIISKRVSYQFDWGNGQILFCLCPCGQPMVLRMQSTPFTKNEQWPIGPEFAASDRWPADLKRLFNEGAIVFAAGAYTACAMVARKILMAVACAHGETDGKPFGKYVDHIVTNVLPIPSVRQSIDKIRTIGNDANHELGFVDEVDARRAMEIANYILNTVYAIQSL